MKSRTTIILVMLMFAVALMMTTAAQAVELAPGVTLKILAEFPSNLPGIEKVQLQEIRLEPGAKLEDDVVPATGL